LLDRAHLSPGEIDAKFGDNAKKALHAYEEAQHLPGSDNVSAEVWSKLAVDDRAATTNYTVDEKDVAAILPGGFVCARAGKPQGQSSVSFPLRWKT
jgi:hypothetical protein